MNLYKAFFMLLLSLSFLGCSEHQAIMQTGSPNAVPQSSESKTQDPPTPSPLITPSPQREVSFGKVLKIVPRVVELKNESRRYQIDVVYPQIEGSKSHGILKLNRRIKDLVTKHYQWPLIPRTKEDLRRYHKWPGVFNSVDLDYEVVLATDELLSIYFEVHSYGIGAAHSVQQSFTVNFDVRSKQSITLSGLFKSKTRHLNSISSYCIGELSKNHDPIFKEELAPKAKNYESWNITKRGIRFNFDACAIGGCASGKKQVEIAFGAFEGILNPNGPMRDFLPRRIRTSA